MNTNNSWKSFKLFDGFLSKPEKRLNGYFKGIRQFFNAPQRSIACAPFNIGNVGALQMCPAGQLML